MSCPGIFKCLMSLCALDLSYTEEYNLSSFCLMLQAANEQWWSMLRAGQCLRGRSEVWLLLLLTVPSLEPQLRATLQPK